MCKDGVKRFRGGLGVERGLRCEIDGSGGDGAASMHILIREKTHSGSWAGDEGEEGGEMRCRIELLSPDFIYPFHPPPPTTI